jgi:hypothetical protein
MESKPSQFRVASGSATMDVEVSPKRITEAEYTSKHALDKKKRK